MKQEDKQYEKWLAEVKSRQPILDNPKELDSIYPRQDIRNLAPQRKQRKFLIGAWGSGALPQHYYFLCHQCTTCFTPVSQRTGKQNEYDNWSNSIPLPANLGRNGTSGKKAFIYPLELYATPEVRKAQILQVIKEKTIKIDRI